MIGEALKSERLILPNTQIMYDVAHIVYPGGEGMKHYE